VPSFLCFPSACVSSRFPVEGIIGQGSGFDPTSARTRAYAELIERLCVSCAPAGLLRASYNQLVRAGRLAVDPYAFNCYSAAQLKNLDKHVNSLRSESISWCVAKQILPTVRQVLTPAQLVFVDSSLLNEYPIRRESITTGAAIGLTESLDPETTGVLACVERDSSIGAWFGATLARRISCPHPKVAPIWSYVRRYWLELVAFDVTSDLGIPTTLVFCLDRTGNGPALSAGARAAFTMPAALATATKEALQPRRNARFLSHLRSTSPRNPKTITDNFSRFLYWSDAKRIPEFVTWVNANPPCKRGPSTSDVRPANLTGLCRRLRRHRISLFVTDLTIPELSKVGLRCVKVVSPELHPLYLDESAVALFSRHYGEVSSADRLPPHPIT
jgi:thiazole/oxazole-forming peptide maturase SagD family component